MHELSLVSAAITQAVDTAQRAGASRIVRLTFDLPPDDHITEDSVRTLLAALGRGTPVEDASLAFERPRSGSFALTSIDVLVDDRQPT